MNTEVYIPDYYRVFERVVNGWHLKTGKVFYKKLPIDIDFNDFELLYGISKQQIATELFRVAGGFRWVLSSQLTPQAISLLWAKSSRCKEKT
jgi:hypothetical protein